MVDNYTDVLMPSSDRVKRAPVIRDNVRTPPLLAEHGLSVLLEVFGNSQPRSIFMDFCISKIGVPHNLKVLEIDLDKIEAFVISHGHHDHVGAIVEALSPLSRKPLVPRYTYRPIGWRNLPSTLSLENLFNTVLNSSLIIVGSFLNLRAKWLSFPLRLS